MNDTSRDKWLMRSLVLILTFSFVAGVVIAVEAFSQMRTAAKQSAQYALFKELYTELEKYKEMHGTYPKDLESLPLTYPKGGDASFLKMFRYETDGATYLLRSTGIATHTNLFARATDGNPHVEWGDSSETKTKP